MGTLPSKTYRNAGDFQLAIVGLSSVNRYERQEKCSAMLYKRHKPRGAVGLQNLGTLRKFHLTAVAAGSNLPYNAAIRDRFGAGDWR